MENRTRIILTSVVVSTILTSAVPAVFSQDGVGKQRRPKKSPHVRYFGHYWVESKTYGSHLNEISDLSNVSWVADITGVRKCAAKKVQCILQTRWEFFSGGRSPKGRRVNRLRPDYKFQWDRTAKAIEAHIDTIEAFYVLDEPFWNGASSQDLDKAIKAIKDRFPRKPVMVVFAYPSLTRQLVVPEKADWIGFDHYAPINVVAKDLRLLKSKLRPHQHMFLVPQSFLNKTARTDAALARLNRQYYALATSEPRVIGLLYFGLFTQAKRQRIPRTIQMQRKIASFIRKRNRGATGSP